MTLYLNARFLDQPASGVQRYARELVGALDRALQADPALAAGVGPVVALHPGGVAPTGWRAIEQRAVPGARGHLWEQGPLWRASRDGVLVSLCNCGPLAHRRQILALHDANVFRDAAGFSRRYRALHRRLRPALARRAARLVTVSGFSARELADVLGVRPARFAVIGNAATHLPRVPPDPDALAAHALTPGGYFLAVGNRTPNKNLARLAAAHARAGCRQPPLVIAGGTMPGVAWAQAAGGVGVRALGRVDDATLRALYDGAAAFVWPSLYEGFGIPPLEAMALGVPVLSSDRTAMPEVLGDAPLYFDPEDVESMTAALRQAAAWSPEEIATRGAAGLARAARFSWEDGAHRLLRLVREITS